MEGSQPSFRALSPEEYNRDILERVREPDMQASTLYSFMCELEWSRYGDHFEFPTLLNSVELHDESIYRMGRASLGLLVLSENISEPLVALNALSEDGIITPEQPRRISHPRHGHLGVITRGFLIGPAVSPSLISASTPSSLAFHEPAAYSRTKTGEISIVGIAP